MRKTPIVYLPAVGRVKRVDNAADVTKLAWKKTSFFSESPTNLKFVGCSAVVKRFLRVIQDLNSPKLAQTRSFATENTEITKKRRADFVFFVFSVAKPLAAAPSGYPFFIVSARFIRCYDEFAIILAM